MQHRSLALHLDVGPLGKHGVEVRGDHDARPRRGAGPIAEHVADFVHADVLQPELLKDALQLLATNRFHERGRRDFAETDLIGDGLRFGRLRRIERGFDRWILEQIRGRCRRRLLSAGAQRERSGEKYQRNKSLHGVSIALE